MESILGAAAGPLEIIEDERSGEEAIRISAPDGEGHSFIVTSEPDAGDGTPSSDEAGRYAREGA